MNSLAQDLGLGWNTVAEYVSLLETAYLCFRTSAWSRNLTTKAIKHPKVYLVDPGLAARLVRTDAARLSIPGEPAAGPLLETFVASELARQATWANTDVRLHHFRDRNGPEVDVVMESSQGRVVGVEVKAASSVSAADLGSSRLLRDRLGPDFASGVVLYGGTQTVAFGDRLWAAPISALWA